VRDERSGECPGMLGNSPNGGPPGQRPGGGGSIDLEVFTLK